MKDKRRSKVKIAVMTHVTEANAAGIDVGSTEMYVAVPPDRDAQSVRHFATFTSDLIRLAEWLKQCGITSVAMESTSVFWIPLFQILQHMQKALDQMNLQLHHVISDITGTTGMAIVDAILAGERDAQKLSELRNKQIKASPETVRQSLIGDYRAEHVFVLRQSLTAYRQYQAWIVDCDREIEKQHAKLESKVDPNKKPLPKSKDRHKPRRNEARFDLRTH